MVALQRAKVQQTLTVLTLLVDFGLGRRDTRLLLLLVPLLQ